MGLRRFGRSLTRPVGLRDGLLSVFTWAMLGLAAVALARLWTHAATPTPSALFAPDCEVYKVSIDLLKGTGPVIAAFAAAMVAVVAWLVKSLLSFLVWHHGECSDRIDLMTAIRSEIVTNASSENVYADDATLNDIIAKIDASPAAGPIHQPYVVTTKRPPVSDELGGQFKLLAPSVSKRVSAYINLSDALDAQLADLRSKAFLKLSRERQISMWRQIFNLGKSTVDAGVQAEQRLQKHIRRQYAYLNATRAGAAAVLACASLALAQGGPRWLRPYERLAAKWVDACSSSVAANPIAAHDNIRSVP